MTQISPLMFLSSEKELFSWTYLLKETPGRTKILMFPVSNKILKIWDIFFELIQIEVECSKKYFNFFYHKELELLKTAKKRNCKGQAKVENINILNIDRAYLLCLQSDASGSFLQACISFVKQRLKCFHFKGSTTP